MNSRLIVLSQIIHEKIIILFRYIKHKYILYKGINISFFVVVFLFNNKNNNYINIYKKKVQVYITVRYNINKIIKKLNLKKKKRRVRKHHYSLFPY